MENELKISLKDSHGVLERFYRWVCVTAA